MISRRTAFWLGLGADFSLADSSTNAEQLTRLQTWRAILSRAFQAFLKGRPL
jgi:hypothetical protein